VIPLSVTVADYLLAGSYPTNYAVTLADTSANILALTTTQLAALSGNHVDAIDATDDTLPLTVAAWRALGTVALTAGDVVSIADTGATLAGLTRAEIGARAAAGVDRLDATDDALSLSVAAYRALGSVALNTGDVVTIADTSANLATLTQAEIAALATAGID